MSLPDAFTRLADLLGRFPGVGEKTARRMVFFMLTQPSEWATSLAGAISSLHESIGTCPECGGITTEGGCRVCTDPMRDRRTICVVETQEDCAAIEQSGVYSGLYHVLGGRCSPLDDQEIPDESLAKLRERIEEGGIGEVILAMSPRVEGDMTAFAVQDALEGLPVRITRLSYGLPVGGSIGYADRVTLHVALESRREMGPE